MSDTPPPSDPADDLPPVDAAEYVLGTLPATERAAFEAAMATDPALRDAVRRWEDWLAGLNDAIPEIAPGAGVWAAIQRALFPAAPTAAPPVVDLALRRSRARWRAATLAFGAIAAGLALFIANGALRPQPQLAAAPSYLAVVNRGGDLPALIVHVDTASDEITVRSLAAETPADRNLQLWFIGAGQTPRSLGLLNQPQTRAALPAAPGDLAGATLAVSVEPIGGSPTGQPTGPVVYSGKLIRE